MICGLVLNSFNRRTFGAMLAALVTAPALPAAAMTVNSAKSLVEQVVDDINAIIASGKTEAAMIKDFEQIFVNYGNVPIIARYTLGADARSMTDAQLASYTKAFQGYMARKYGKRFEILIGGEIKVRGAKKVKSFIEVMRLCATIGRSNPVWFVLDVITSLLVTNVSILIMFLELLPTGSGVSMVFSAITSCRKARQRRSRRVGFMFEFKITYQV